MDKKAKGTIINFGGGDLALSQVLKEASNTIDTSKQVDGENGNQWISPMISFEVYDTIYTGSYIVAAIINKIAFAFNSGLETNNPELKTTLESLDFTFASKSLTKYGNLFIEVVRNKKGEVVETKPFVTSTVVKVVGGGYVQQVLSSTTYFNEFCGDSEKRAAGVKIWEESGAGEHELRNTPGKGTGYNPNITECYQIKLSDTNQRRYGVSFFQPVLEQVLLLKLIDQYYMKYMEGGAMNLGVFSTEDPLDDETLENFKKWLKDEVKGVKNSHSNFLLDTPLTFTKITDTIDTTAFLEYRKKLEISIAMGLNFPYDLLNPENANRASSDTAMETLYQYLIFPLQQLLIRASQDIYRGTGQYTDDDLDSLQFVKLDTKDNLNEAKAVAELYNSGIITKDEARAWMGYKPSFAGDGESFKEKADFGLNLGKEDIDTIKAAADLAKKQTQDAITTTTSS